MFKNRFEAGTLLAQELQEYAHNPDVIILAIPRGGLEIGFPIAKALNAPLDVLLTKKIGFPGNPEYAIGAASLESVIVDKRFLDLSPEMRIYVDNEVKHIRELLKKRYAAYQQGAQPLSLEHKIVIVVDDGVATGHTIASSLELVKKNNPKKLIVAVPVAPPDALKLLRMKADEVISLLAPTHFRGVGQFYERFDQVSDQEALQLLRKARA